MEETEDGRRGDGGGPTVQLSANKEGGDGGQGLALEAGMGMPGIGMPWLQERG